MVYVKQDVLCTAFSFARFCKTVEKITDFSMNDCSPGLGWKNFESLRTKEVDPFYTYDDKYMRRFLRQSNKRKRVCAFNQYYKSKTCGDLKIKSRGIKVEGDVYNIIEAFMKYKNDHLKKFKDEYESNFDDYRDIDEKETNDYISKNLGEFPIHSFLKHSGLNGLIWDSDAVSLHRSAMSDEKNIYPKKRNWLCFHTRYGERSR